ncbi:hypothetical protein H2199_001291 [Coniosporium tulheliwenetii]|uniref:Uncharacterized protein n=1 Tax=Coniosporium tulheliwenetii TaxID=3383036 RepID=A0ACC2ZM37_9PEZI|nr:hypothetical protein H2199_001291 [Cladosporium sp. JES 115]
MFQEPRDRPNNPARRDGQSGGHQRGRGRGRGDHHGGRDRANFNNRASPAYPQSVPTIQYVTPGAFVSIVLKVDQPTGREVQGAVSEVLTNGNHPRGIKVRLRDGRVGRVQRMVSQEEAAAGESGLSNLGRNGEPTHTTSVMGVRPSRFAARYTDARDEWHPDAPERHTLSLGDYLKPGSKGFSAEETDDRQKAHPDPSERVDFVFTTICPVCNTFEGDETAVAHHVESHFAD